MDLDWEAAVKCYRSAAEEDHASAQNALGFCYQKGLGVGEDKKEAVRLYRKSADQGVAAAQCDPWCGRDRSGLPGR